MRIDRLAVTHLRNLTHVTLEPAPGLNLLWGPNAAGKTALLEAVYLLARARSFRTARIDEVIQRGNPRLTVRAEVSYDAGESVAVALERGEGRLVLRRGGENISTVSVHARSVPVVILTPDSQQLVIGGPGERRDWLDWAMFHVEPPYLDHWRAYFRALRQRNRLLRDGAPPGGFTPWEAAMAVHGEALTAGRVAFLMDVADAARALAAQVGLELPEITLDPGWEQGGTLTEALAQTRTGDMARGHSSIGPHRADVLFRLEGLDAGSVLSRGESKLFVIVLLLAEAQVRARRQSEKPVLLLDDYAAELDAEAQGKVLNLLATQGVQAFLTSTQRSGKDLGEASATFHVERGKVGQK